MLRKTGAFLLSGVSALAISVALAHTAQAADIPPKAYYKAPPPVPVNPWTFWIEGGAQGVAGGDSSITGLTPAFTPGKRTWGWSGAAAIDYRIDPFWHVSFCFRYGQNRSRTTNSNQVGFAGFSTTPFSGGVSGPNSATRTESNWVADFMVGRELGLGTGTSLVKFGLRVAQITGTTDGAGQLARTSPVAIYNFFYNQTSKWTGYGPRLAIEGNAPISGPWSLDYMGGVAGLFGSQSVTEPSSLTLGGTAVSCLVGCPVTFFSPSTNYASSSNNAVFNADAMLGLAYAVTPNSKVALNYRVDYYANAMRTLNSAGAASNTNRTYHGPNLRWTVNF